MATITREELPDWIRRGFAQHSREIRDVDLHVSSISRGDVSLFQRKVAFYEREEKGRGQADDFNFALF